MALHVFIPSDADQTEIDRAVVYLYLCGRAVAAGCTPREAAVAIYPDAFPEGFLRGEPAEGKQDNE